MPDSDVFLCDDADLVSTTEQGRVGEAQLQGLPTDFDQLELSEWGLDWSDIRLIRDRLALTPIERLRAAQDLMRAVFRLRRGKLS